ncbi:hypothetical protein JAAARDRAFT_237329 [Jaapia argillacea MUCL 33604]|uniref:Uncharacterized protein n=1 Tax=Jaapia argillacea MUCL 33604 TaxID=933084 RepID=A0A067QF04_9AGAM|nr:hypothetical protein JAAARDRAFT_237329 [Jaapia argillacea MUCL 33604]
MSNGDAELHQTNLKRSASVQWLPTKRAKSYPQEPKHFKPSPDPGRLHTDPPLNKPPTRGVYCVGLPLASRDSPTYETELWGLITEATNELARQNKRLVRTPQVLSDGIIFDWCDSVAPTCITRSLTFGASGCSISPSLRRSVPLLVLLALWVFKAESQLEPIRRRRPLLWSKKRTDSSWLFLEGRVTTLRMQL